MERQTNASESGLLSLGRVRRIKAYNLPHTTHRPGLTAVFCSTCPTTKFIDHTNTTPTTTNTNTTTNSATPP